MATVQHKTPGVYISEPDSFPPSVVGVETAVPVFVGYTEKAVDARISLHLRPTRISSLAEYVQGFGGACPRTYYLLTEGDAKPKSPGDRVIAANFTFVDGGDAFQLVESAAVGFNLYDSLRLFYSNGGGACYIVSCGTYDTGAVARGDLLDGLEAVANEVGPTMLVVPDAVLLADQADFDSVSVAMLRQCVSKQDRVAILDVWGARAVHDEASLDAAIDRFRTGLAGAPPESLRYGMAYFPFLVTSVVPADDVGIANFTGDAGLATLKTALGTAAARLYPAGDGKSDPRVAEIKACLDMLGASLPGDQARIPLPDRTPPGRLTHDELARTLRANIPGFGDMFRHAAQSRNTLPPSGAMAGLFTTTDNSRGVWNAPANVGISGLIAPTFEITDAQQQGLNTPLQGLAVNAIRTFPGRGSLVWGARTLDSNSDDWRYIMVRRTTIYVEQSVKTALSSFVFAPHTALTWTTIVSMVESFLHGLWAAGGLIGASPAEAYGVRCGLGSTMTPEDVLEGYVNVLVVLQMVRPGQFIEFVFRQQMLGAA